jgi:hypothetical protein
MAPRDTFTGVGVGRKACSEAGEAIRWGHFLLHRCDGANRVRKALGFPSVPANRRRHSATAASSSPVFKRQSKLTANAQKWRHVRHEGMLPQLKPAGQEPVRASPIRSTHTASTPSSLHELGSSAGWLSGNLPMFSVPSQGLWLVSEGVAAVKQDQLPCIDHCCGRAIAWRCG